MMKYDDHASTVFFFNDTAPTEIYTLSLHDALPIFAAIEEEHVAHVLDAIVELTRLDQRMRRAHQTLPEVVLARDRKSTRLNSSHSQISYAVFCLKKKKNNE